jgi:probable addiction module antidote protein
MKASLPFNESRKALLKDPEVAALYLEESLQDGNMEEFKQALKHVAEARLGGMAALSRTTRLNRESLYRALSEKGNPRLDTLTKVLSAVGLRIGVNVHLDPKHP